MNAFQTEDKKHTAIKHDTHKCLSGYMNILHYKYGKPPTCTCFGHLLWPSSGRFYTKDILQRHQKPIPAAHTYFFNFRMVIQYTIVHGTFTTHLNLAQIITYVFYILIYVLRPTF